MQKRRGHAILPMTEADAVKMSGGMNVILGGPGRTALPGKKRRKAKNGFVRSGRRDYSRLWGALMVVVVGLIVLTGIYYCFLSSTSSSKSSNLTRSDMEYIHGGGGITGMIKRHRQRRRQKQQQSKPLAHFPTLQYPLQHTKLIGLYFAASWCTKSTPVTQALDEYFRDIILPPKSEDEEAVRELKMDRYPLAIVHVSSDTKEAKFQDYIRQNWIAVPFDTPEKTALKRKFQVCAQPEVEFLGIDRKYEIPTLLIVDSETQTILTANGVEDLEEFEGKALQHWMELHDLVRGMEEKYAKQLNGVEEEEEEEKKNVLALDPARKEQRRRAYRHNNGAAAAGAVGELFGPN
jgi:hypothetical protein